MGKTIRPWERHVVCGFRPAFVCWQLQAYANDVAVCAVTLKPSSPSKFPRVVVRMSTAKQY